MDDVFGGDFFEGVAGFFPGVEASDDNLGFEAAFLEEFCYALAGGLVLATAVEINFALFGEGGEEFGEAVGLDADGAEDAVCT